MKGRIKEGGNLNIKNKKGSIQQLFLNDIDTLLPTAHSLSNKVVKLSYTNINNNNNMVFKTQQSKANNNKQLKRSTNNNNNNVVTSHSNCKRRNQLQNCKSASTHISQLNQNELIEYIQRILAINNQLTNELNELKYNKTKQQSRQQGNLCPNYVRQCKTKSNTPNNTHHNVSANSKYKSTNHSPSFKHQQKKIKTKDVHNIRNKLHSVYYTNTNSNANGNNSKHKKPTYTRSAKQIFTGLIKHNQQGKQTKVLTMSNSINKCIKHNMNNNNKSSNNNNNNSVEYFLPKTQSINNCVMKNLEENSKRKDTFRKQVDKMYNSHEYVSIDKHHHYHHQQQQQQQRLISRYKIQQRELDLKAFEKYSEDLLSINNNNNSTNGIHVNSNRYEGDVINIVENYKTLNDDNNNNNTVNVNVKIDEDDDKYIEAYDLPLQLESYSNKRNKKGGTMTNNNSISVKGGNEYYTYNHDEEEMKLDSTGRKYAKERMNVIMSTTNTK